MSAGWEQLQNQLEHERWLTEHCEHGVPKDSGKLCLECIMNSGPDRKEWEREYEEWLKEIDSGTV